MGPYNLLEPESAWPDMETDSVDIVQIEKCWVI